MRASGSGYEHFVYPGVRGHLFSDRTLPGEHDQPAAELMFGRALEFLGNTRANR